LLNPPAPGATPQGVAALPAGGGSPRAVNTAVFFAFALGFGLLSGAIPALMQQAGVGAAGLGAALTLHTVCYIGAMAAGGPLARRLPLRRLIQGAVLVQAATVVAVFNAASPAALAGALAAMGAASGLLDLCMNTEGTAIEREQGRPLLTRMHAAASAGFSLGALGGSLLATAAGPRWCSVPLLLASLPAAWAVQRLGPRLPAAAEAVAPAGTRVGEAASDEDHAARRAARRAVLRQVGVLGLVLGVCIAAESTAQMWSAQLLQRQSAALAALAGAGAAMFAGCQALTRLGGDALRHRLGDRRLLIGSLALAASGFGVVAATGSFAGSLTGFALVGLGTACVVPCCFALVVRQAPQRAALALAAAGLVAGLVRVPTPLLVGLVASRWSDAAAFGGVALVLGAASLLAWRAVAVGAGRGPAAASAPAPG
jgi:hypothetical protein